MAFQPLTLAIDSARKGVSFAIYLHKDLAKVPAPVARPSASNAHPAYLTSEDQTKPPPSIYHRFVAHFDAPLKEETLYVSARKRERTYSITAELMISGLVLTYLKDDFSGLFRLSPQLRRSLLSRDLTGHKRSFLSLPQMRPKPLKNIVPQTLGETIFDFVTFLATLLKADIGTRCSIKHFGLKAVLRVVSLQKKNNFLSAQINQIQGSHVRKLSMYGLCITSVPVLALNLGGEFGGIWSDGPWVNAPGALGTDR